MEDKSLAFGNGMETNKRQSSEMLEFIYLLVAAGSTDNNANANTQPPLVRTVEPTRPQQPRVIVAPSLAETSKRAGRPYPVAKGNPAMWVNWFHDYPADALASKREGTAAYRLTVGPNGRANRCEITQTSGWPDIDQTTCISLIRRARFDPALNARGYPIEGFFQSHARWQLPPRKMPNLP